AGEDQNTALVLNNIGAIYLVQKDYNQALKYFNQAIPYAERTGEKRNLAFLWNNMGVIYQAMGELGKAKEFWLKSLEARKEMGDISATASLYNNIASLYREEGDTSRIFEFYFKSVAIYEEAKDKRGLSFQLNNIGKLYLNTGNLDSAMVYAKRANQLALEVNLPENIERTEKLLYRLYKLSDEAEKALGHYETYITMRDSTASTANQKAAIRQQMKYDYEKAQLVKEQNEQEGLRLQAEAISRRDNLQYSVVLIGLLVIGLLVAMLGKLSLPIKLAEGLIFFAFLLFFEFILVLADPYVERWTGGAPGLKLLVNAAVAALIFPLHSFFEGKLKGRSTEGKRTFTT
ncbi:MAG: tetratricopeptide repeat protein, partial [Flavobacteriales bacterium]|nr:tetratricopeptide repeat protein [Flavobacteriales bacterium]